MFAICIGMHRITVFVPHRFDARLEGSFRVGMVTSPSYNNGGHFLSHSILQCNGICRLIPVTSLGKQTEPAGCSSTHSSSFPAKRKSSGMTCHSLLHFISSLCSFQNFVVFLCPFAYLQDDYATNMAEVLLRERHLKYPELAYLWSIQ